MNGFSAGHVPLSTALAVPEPVLWVTQAELLGYLNIATTWQALANTVCLLLSGRVLLPLFISLSKLSGCLTLGFKFCNRSHTRPPSGFRNTWVAHTPRDGSYPIQSEQPMVEAGQWKPQKLTAKCSVAGLSKPASKLRYIHLSSLRVSLAFQSRLSLSSQEPWFPPSHFLRKLN